MSKDPIVEEVRRARDAQAAKHGFDVHAILSAAKKRQRRSARRVVSFVRKNRKLSAWRWPLQARPLKRSLSYSWRLVGVGRIARIVTTRTGRV